MKNFILCEDVYCTYFARDKKDLLDYIKEHYRKWDYWRFESMQDFTIRDIEYNARKIDVDNFFWDIIATDKKTDESIDFNDYEKFWIKTKEIKKDFLYLTNY